MIIFLPLLLILRIDPSEAWLEKCDCSAIPKSASACPYSRECDNTKLISANCTVKCAAGYQLMFRSGIPWRSSSTLTCNDGRHQPSSGSALQASVAAVACAKPSKCTNCAPLNFDHYCHPDYVCRGEALMMKQNEEGCNVASCAWGDLMMVDTVMPSSQMAFPSSSSSSSSSSSRLLPQSPKAPQPSGPTSWSGTAPNTNQLSSTQRLLAGSSAGANNAVFVPGPGTGTGTGTASSGNRLLNRNFGEEPSASRPLNAGSGSQALNAGSGSTSRSEIVGKKEEEYYDDDDSFSPSSTVNQARSTVTVVQSTTTRPALIPSVPTTKAVLATTNAQKLDLLGRPISNNRNRVVDDYDLPDPISQRMNAQLNAVKKTTKDDDYDYEEGDGTSGSSSSSFLARMRRGVFSFVRRQRRRLERHIFGFAQESTAQTINFDQKTASTDKLVNRVIGNIGSAPQQSAAFTQSQSWKNFDYEDQSIRRLTTTTRSPQAGQVIGNLNAGQSFSQLSQAQQQQAAADWFGSRGRPAATTTTRVVPQINNQNQFAGEVGADWNEGNQLIRDNVRTPVVWTTTPRMTTTFITNTPPMTTTPMIVRQEQTMPMTSPHLIDNDAAQPSRMSTPFTTTLPHTIDFDSTGPRQRWTTPRVPLIDGEALVTTSTTTTTTTPPPPPPQPITVWEKTGPLQCSTQGLWYDAHFALRKTGRVTCARKKSCGTCMPPPVLRACDEKYECGSSRIISADTENGCVRGVCEDGESYIAIRDLTTGRAVTDLRELSCDPFGRWRVSQFDTISERVEAVCYRPKCKKCALSELSCPAGRYCDIGKLAEPSTDQTCYSVRCGEGARLLIRDDTGLIRTASKIDCSHSANWVLTELGTGEEIAVSGAEATVTCEYNPPPCQLCAPVPVTHDCPGADQRPCQPLTQKGGVDANSCRMNTCEPGDELWVKLPTGWTHPDKLSMLGCAGEAGWIGNDGVTKLPANTPAVCKRAACDNCIVPTVSAFCPKDHGEKGCDAFAMRRNGTRFDATTGCTSIQCPNEGKIAFHNPVTGSLVTSTKQMHCTNGQWLTDIGEPVPSTLHVTCVGWSGGRGVCGNGGCTYSLEDKRAQMRYSEVDGCYELYCATGNILGFNPKLNMWEPANQGHFTCSEKGWRPAYGVWVPEVTDYQFHIRVRCQ